MSKLKFLILLIILNFPISVFALTYPNLHYSKAIIYDLTDDYILYDLNANEKTSVASLTKILTVITAIEKINDFNTEITYTKEMQKLVRQDTSKAGLNIGDTITYEDLLYAAMLPSGADATIAIALTICNSLEEFVNLMNETALKIDMENSHFTNVIGLDEDNHYSTAADILKLLKYALNNSLFYKIYNTKEYTLSNGLKVTSTLYHYNKSNLDTSRIIGSKTGFTAKAGLCISTYIKSNNHDILIITLNTPKTKEFYHLEDTISLINFLDNNYSNQIIFTPDDIITSLDVTKSNIKTYLVKTSNYVYAYLPNDYLKKDIKTLYVGKTQISPLDNGKQIGTINYYYEDNLIYTENFFITEEIKDNYPKKFITFFLMASLLILLQIFKPHLITSK